jgi:hypothetical protein
MEGEEVYEGGIILTGDFWGIDFFGGSLGFVGGVSSGVGGLVQGHRFAGGFGHGGQDIHMISWS